MQIEQALIIVVHNTMPSSYMKPYTADRKSHDPVMMKDDVINKQLHTANQEIRLVDLVMP